MKVKLKTYKYNGTLRREFPSVEEAQKFSDLMAKMYPDTRFEPYIEQEGSGKNDSSNSEAGEITQTLKESSDNFLDLLSDLFENEE